MKTFGQSLCILFLGVLLFSCSQSTEEMVIGRWKIEDVTVPLPNVADSLKPYYQDQIKKQNAELLASGYYEFKKGGQGFFEISGNRMEGKWRLSEDNKKIFFKEKSDVNESRFEIKEISTSVFILEVNEQGQQARIVMKKKI